MANAPMAERTTPPMMMRGVLCMVRFRVSACPTRALVSCATMGKQRRDHTQSRVGGDRLTDCVVWEWGGCRDARFDIATAIRRRGIPRGRGIPQPDRSDDCAATRDPLRRAER